MIIHFATPIWILIGLLTCVSFYFVFQWIDKQKERALKSFAAGSLLQELTANVSRSRRNIKRFLLLMGLFCCFVALARPQYGYRWIDVSRKGIDILFAVDTSRSMLAQDIEPNRLERSKFAILDFINQLEGDRVGLMPFAGSSFLMCPLTVDYGAFEQSLKAVDADIIPESGTNIAQAIDHSLSVLSNDANHKLLIIITDGENLAGDTRTSALQAQEEGMLIFTVGVGTAQGELIPYYQNGKQHFMKDEDGTFVTSRLDETGLRDIADITGGLYAPLGNRGQGLETIYAEKLALIPKEDLLEKRQKVPVEKFPWAIAAAFLFLLCEYTIGERKGVRPAIGINKNLFRFKRLFLFLLLTFSSFPSDSLASPGEEAYQREDYITATEYYQEALKNEPDNRTLHYNLGVAAYKNNLFQESIESFNNALKSNDISLQEKAYYNRGNAQYRKGEENITASPEKTVELWQNAQESYESVLQLQPDNLKAKQNNEIVKKKLAELQKQLQEQQQKQNSDSDQQNEQDKEEQKQAENNKNPNQEQQQSSRKSGDNSDDSENATPKNGDREETTSQKSESSPEEQKTEQPEEAGNAHAGQDNTNKPDGSQSLNKMSQEQALQLLDEIKNDEGNLNFIPRKKDNSQTESRRTW